MEAKQLKTSQTKDKSNPQVKTAYRILFIIGFVHLLNDSIQALVPAMFPILEAGRIMLYDIAR